MAENITFAPIKLDNNSIEIACEKTLEAAEKAELRRLMYERIAAGNAIAEAEETASHNLQIAKR